MPIWHRWLLAAALATAASAPAFADSVTVAPRQPGLVVPRFGLMYDAGYVGHEGPLGVELGLQIQPWRDPGGGLVFGPHLLIESWTDFSGRDRVGVELGYYLEFLERPQLLRKLPHWLRFGGVFGVVVDYWSYWDDNSEVSLGNGIGAALLIRPTLRIGRLELSTPMELGRIDPIDDWYWSQSFQLGLVLF